MTKPWAGPGGITEGQARRITFETNHAGDLIISRCRACSHRLLSDAVAGERIAHHNRAKARHREEHWSGLWPNEKVKEAS